MDNKYEQMDINNEKVAKIINAAFEVFANNDFEKASTNNVVKQAGISRGLLYHYFKGKQDLFEFLIYCSVKAVVIDMESKINWENTDILDRLRETIYLKFEIMKKYPKMIDFFNKYSDKISNSYVKNKYEEIALGIREKFYLKNLDFSLIKDGIEVEKVIYIAEMTLRGIAKDYWDNMKSSNEIYDFDIILKECDEYIEFFKKQFYK